MYSVSSTYYLKKKRYFNIKTEKLSSLRNYSVSRNHLKDISQELYVRKNRGTIIFV